MDIEPSLRQLRVLRDPGVRFTDGVMSRVGDVPVVEPREGVVLIAEARTRKRSRRIQIATAVAVAVAAAAAIPTLMFQDQVAPAVVQVAVPQPASVLTPTPPDSGLIAQVQAEQPEEGVDPLECLDMDVVRGLLLQGWSNPTFSTSTDLPAEMAGFTAPGQFTMIGSTRRSPAGIPGQSTVSVVYRSGLAPEAARAAGVRAVAAGGWNLHSTGMFPMPNVFRSGNSVLSGETWCREGMPLAISASAIDGVTYVILSASRNTDRNAGFMNACEQSPRPARVASAFDQLMPTLEMPIDPATGKQVPSRGEGGSNGEVKRRVSTSFTIRDSIGNVAQHFARQMAEQGWNSEASWTGSQTAGSTWTRQMDSDTVLQGMLVVSAFEDDRFSTAFHVVQTK